MQDGSILAEKGREREKYAQLLNKFEFLFYTVTPKILSRAFDRLHTS